MKLGTWLLLVEWIHERIFEWQRPLEQLNLQCCHRYNTAVHAKLLRLKFAKDLGQQARRPGPNSVTAALLAHIGQEDMQLIHGAHFNNTNGCRH